MKTIKTLLILCIAFGVASCSKEKDVTVPALPQQIIPNHDFESWTDQLPVSWQTNSCPACVPPFETYIVQQDTDAYQGQFAAKFIYNNVYAAWAENTFSVTGHPAHLTAYVKSNLAANDSVLIRIKLFNNNTEVDSGEWHGTASIANYTQIVIPISQNATQADMAKIYIEGGNVNAAPGNNTELWVDQLELE
jgi:hypothetical protein